MRLTIGTLALLSMFMLAIDKAPAHNRTEHDPDLRADCVMQLLTLDQEPLNTGMIVGTLNYTDKQYGGPCAALDHRIQNGWY